MISTSALILFSKKHNSVRGRFLCLVYIQLHQLTAAVSRRVAQNVLLWYKGQLKMKVKVKLRFSAPSAGIAEIA